MDLDRHVSSPSPRRIAALPVQRIFERRDLDDAEMTLWWTRLTARAQMPTGPGIPNGRYVLRHEIGECPASDTDLALIAQWSHPASVTAMAHESGSSMRDVWDTAYRMVVHGLLDHVGEGRLIASQEGMIHSLAHHDAARVLMCLLESRTGSLYYDEIRTRSMVEDHHDLSHCLALLVERGRVRSEGILYSAERVPMRSV
jgi:hypothetical protein